MNKLKNLILKYFNKLFVFHWTIGISCGNIKDILRNKSFDPDIKWLPLDLPDRFFADPFFLKTKEGNYNILVEDFSFNKNYGRISLITVDKTFELINKKILLDTKNHFSYPFIFKENDKLFIFPESGKTKKLSCYEYDPFHELFHFQQDVLDLPILDPTILKHNNKYWLFGTLYGKDSLNKLYIYYSDNLMGPYEQHPQNPVKNGLNGSRSAGSFIEVDGALYRPSQNCENLYGESITINKIDRLDEFTYHEEPYMSLHINKKNKLNHGIHGIHTINVEDEVIVIDGLKKKFAPFSKLKSLIVRSLKKPKNRSNLPFFFLIGLISKFYNDCIFFEISTLN